MHGARRSILTWLLTTTVVAHALAQSPPPEWRRAVPMPGFVSGICCHTLAEDPRTGDIYLFGAQSPGAPYTAVLRNGGWEPWTWSGPGPGPRDDAALAYSPIRHALVMFGGFRGSYTNDTWIYDLESATWSPWAGVTTPPGRAGHAMVGTPNGVLMFGGNNNRYSGALSGDTWRFDATGWHRLTPTTSPAPRTDHAMVYADPWDRIVLFGGRTRAGDTTTWEWDGNDWRATQVTNAPQLRIGLAYDRRRERVVLCGSRSGTIETWEFDGTHWLDVTTTAGSPDPSRSYNGAYDSRRNHVVLVGETPATTHEYFPFLAAEISGIGFGCGAQPALGGANATRAWAAETFSAELTGVPGNALLMSLWLGSSTTSWFGAFPLPRPLDPLGMPGCNLYVQGDVVLPLTLHGTTASRTLSIPYEFVGVSFHAQALVHQPGANAADWIVSNAITATVGIR